MLSWVRSATSIGCRDDDSPAIRHPGGGLRWRAIDSRFIAEGCSRLPQRERFPQSLWDGG